MAPGERETSLFARVNAGLTICCQPVVLRDITINSKRLNFNDDFHHHRQDHHNDRKTSGHLDEGDARVENDYVSTEADEGRRGRGCIVDDDKGDDHDHAVDDLDGDGEGCLG